MKKIFCIWIFILSAISVFGQETEREIAVKVKSEIKNKREPESHWSNLLSLQIGFTFGIHNSVGSNFNIFYERKLQNKPIAWFANYTAGKLFGSENERVLISDDQFGTSTDFSYEFHHFGGGLHYYPLPYERSFKPYFGAGGFIGVNQSEYEFYDKPSISEHGLDAGVYGVIGSRWFTRLFRIGVEYRFGYINSEIFGVKESYSIHEIVFSFSLRF